MAKTTLNTTPFALLGKAGGKKGGNGARMLAEQQGIKAVFGPGRGGRA